MYLVVQDRSTDLLFNHLRFVSKMQLDDTTKFERSHKIYIQYNNWNSGASNHPGWIMRML